LPLGYRDETYTWDNIVRHDWWIRKIAVCRRKKSALQFIKGILFLMLVFLTLMVYYNVRPYEKTGINLEPVSYGLLKYTISSTDTAFILALFVGFILGAVYKSPTKILQYLLVWRSSWIYNRRCLEEILTNVESALKDRMDNSRSRRFEEAKAALLSNWSTLENEEQFRKEKDPRKKLHVLIQDFVCKLMTP